MRSQSNSTFIATCDGIFVNGLPLTKLASKDFSPHTQRYLKRAEELLKQVKPEDWDSRTPHVLNDIPLLAQTHMMLALASPQVFDKYNHNHRGPGPGGGQFTTAGNSEGITDADRQNPQFKGMTDTEIKKQKFVNANLDATMRDRILNKYVFLLFVFLGLFLSNDAIAEASEKVDIELGLQLAESIYPHAGIGAPNKRNETFLIYQILGKYEGTVAWLAVNPWTGDVWDMNECRLLSNPALQKAQARIKEQFSANELKEYERLHNIKPYREYDLEACP